MTYSPEWWSFIESLPSQGVIERHMAHVRARIAEFSPWASEPHVEWIAEIGDVAFAWSEGRRYVNLRVNNGRSAEALFCDGTAHSRVPLDRDELIPFDVRSLVESMRPDPSPEFCEDEPWGVP